MTYNAELSHLIKYMLRLRERKDLNGYETPIIVDIEELNRKLIPDLNFLNERLLELVNEYVPVEGEGSRKTVISHLEHLEGGKIKIHGSSTDKLRYFLKKMGGTDEAKAKMALPTIQPPLPPAIEWKRIKMIVNELNEIHFYYLDEQGQEGQRRKIDFEDLGMAGPGKNRPGKLWGVFFSLARARGIYEYSKAGQSLGRQNKVAMTSRLQERFQLSEDPFEQIEDMRYKTKFLIEYRDGFPGEFSRGTSRSLGDYRGGEHDAEAQEELDVD